MNQEQTDKSQTTKAFMGGLTKKSDQGKLFRVILSFELQRALRAKSFFVFIGISLVMGMLFAILIGTSYDYFLEQIANSPFPGETPLFNQIEINSKTWANYFAVNMSMSSFVAQLGLIVSAYYGAKIVTQDMKSGSIVLVLSTQANRGVVLFAKFLATTIVSFLITCFSTFFSVILMTIVPLFTTAEVTFSEVLSYSLIYFLRALLPILLFVLVITAISLLIGVLIRNPTFAIIGAIVALLFYDMLFSTAAIFAPAKWPLGYFSPSANLMEISYWAVGIVSGSEVIFEPVPWVSLIIFAVTLSASLLIAHLRFKRMDL